jgi:predicted outer membrane repeat protein
VTHRFRRLITLAVVIGVAVPLVVGGSPASAAVITVTSTSEGTGGPNCTLRDAITAANTDAATGGCPAGAGADIIELAAGATYTFTTGLASVLDTSALPDITGPVTINGNGAVIERSTAGGTPDFRILTVGGGANVILNNVTLRNGGFVTTAAGAGVLVFNGSLTLDTVTVTGNVGGNGAGIFANIGTLTVSRSTIVGNRATGVGAGIAAGTGATVIVRDSTFAGNTATFQGGALYASAVSFLVENTTLSGNTAGVSGGAIAVAVSLTLSNSTITSNSASAGAGIQLSAPATLHNTVVAANSAGADCLIQIVSPIDASNVDSDGSCDNATTVADPLLGPLAGNGGPTLTHAVLPSSPLIDHGTAPCPAADQRGVGRPLGFGCDAGAFEFTPGGSVTTVTATNAVFDGSPHGGSAVVTGDFGLSQSLLVTYSGRNATVYGPSSTPPTNVGEYTASAAYSGGPNNAPSSGSTDYAITTAPQTISFLAAPPTNVTLGAAPVTVSANASSGLPVTLTASGSCTGSGTSTAIVTFISAGVCTVTATQLGDGNWSAAPALSTNTTVAAQPAPTTSTPPTTTTTATTSTTTTLAETLPDTGSDGDSPVRWGIVFVAAGLLTLTIARRRRTVS